MTVGISKPAGGINNLYRLCEIAEELGITARVVSPTPYPYADPPHLAKYWQYADGHIEVNEGDIVVGPEMWPTKSMFSVPVRRVIYIQNWSISHERQPWEKTFWYYGGVHHNYALHRCTTEVIPAGYYINPTDELQLHQAAHIIKKQKVEWYRVQPYFEFEKFNPVNPNRARNIAIAMPRKCPNVIQHMKQHFPLVCIDNVQPNQVSNFMRNYGVFILATPAEGLSFPAIEALACGTAVVSWPSGAPEEFLIHNETAKMVEYGNVNMMIETTKELLANYELQERLAEKGRALVSKVFTKEQTSAQLYMAYHATCKQNPES